MSHQDVVQLLDKMSAFDKDFRFMALNDLMSKLKKDAIRMDERLERRVVTSVLKLLEDNNSEVQNLAVNCIPILVTRIMDELVDESVKKLVVHMLGNDEKLRDLASIGLKSAIGVISAESQAVHLICSSIITPLLGALSSPTESIVIEVLDILADTLKRFGGRLTADHARLQSALMPMLTHARPVIRKRTIVVIAHLVANTNDELFEALANTLIQSLEKSAKSANARTSISALSTIARESGDRLGFAFPKAVPSIFAASKVDDDELREICLQAMHDFALHASKPFAPFVAQTVAVCLELIKHDPNYIYDHDEASGQGSDMDVSGSEESGEEYSDDDDVSWRVRKAASYTLAAIIKSRPDLLRDMYTSVSPTLIARFKEREENVRVSVLDTYVLLLKQTALVAPLGEDAMADDTHPTALLAVAVPSIVKNLHRQLKDKAPKIRSAVLVLLTELAQAIRNALANNLGELLPGVHHCIADKVSNSDVKMAALAFLSHVLRTHEPAATRAHASTIAAAAVLATRDSFYKITSEALGVCAQLVQVLRDDFSQPATPDVAECVTLLSEAIRSRFIAADTSQEVKERAMKAMSILISTFGDALPRETSESLSVFVSRMENEVTRETAIRCLAAIINSPLNIDMTAIIPSTIHLLTSFLRKKDRVLRIVSLTTLQSIFKTRGSRDLCARLEGSLNTEEAPRKRGKIESQERGMTEELYDGIVSELHSLVSAEDMHVAQQALSLATLCVREGEKSRANHSQLVASALQIVISPLLQGATLDATFTLLRALALSGDPAVSVGALVAQLADTHARSQLPKHAVQNIAKCVAAVAETSERETAALLQTSLANVSAPATEDSVKLLSVLILGELGKNVDLSSQGEHVLGAILSCFSLTSEDGKSAASVALGNVCSGNLAVFLPRVVSLLHENKAIQYLLLLSLKVILNNFSETSARLAQLEPFVETIWTLLFQHCESAEEGTRNIVSECLGKLALVNPEKLIPALAEHLDAPTPFTRSTVISAIRFSASAKVSPSDLLLRPVLQRVFQHIKDADNHVRRVALVALTSTVHNKPNLVAGFLSEFAPAVYDETNVRLDLIREVEMGPFKEKVDDGLDTRKSAFECMYTLVETCAARLDLGRFIDTALKGLTDHYDIQLVTFALFAYLARTHGEDVARRLEDIVDRLTTTISFKVKENAVKQEVEKNDELKRAAVRVVVALKKLPTSEANPKFATVLKMIEAVPSLAARLHSNPNSEAN